MRVPGCSSSRGSFIRWTYSGFMRWSPPVVVPLLAHQLIFLLPTLCDRSIEAEGDSVVINWDSCWVKKIVKQGDKFQKQALARNPHRSPMREGPGAGAEG